MRVVHVNFDYGLAGVGGASIAASRLHNGLLAAGVDSWFVCNHQRETGRNVIEVPKRATLARPFFLYAGKLLRNVWRLSPVRRAVPLDLIPSGMAHEINRLKPDVVHIEWISPDVLSWGELRRILAPMVVSLHDFWMLNGFSPYVGDLRAVTGYEASNSGWLERFLFRKKKEFFARAHPVLVGPSKWVCQSAKESLIGRHLQCETISNVLDTTIFRLRPEMRSAKEKVVVLFGGFGGAGNPLKGFDDLLEALKRLPLELKSRTECHVFGEAAEARVSDGVTVRYLGQVCSVEDMVRIYHSSDLLALPSKHETQGQTKLEALACGLPVVVFDRTACAEGIVHQQNGWIAPDGDCESFKNGIMWCIDQLKRQPGENGWRQEISDAAVEQYGARCVVPQFVDLYRRVRDAGRPKVEALSRD